MFKAGIRVHDPPAQVQESNPLAVSTMAEAEGGDEE